MDNSAIKVEGLVKRFGDVVAVDGVDLNVEPGIVFGLLGPNGAGKTTTIRVLTTVIAPDEGEAYVAGLNVRDHPDAVRRRIGLAGQYAAVDPNLTARENLKLIGRLSRLSKSQAAKRAEELLERFNLASAADRPTGGFSGGMRRRLDLSAALVRRPPILLLDEPTTGLDIQSRNELWNVIAELKEGGRTVLLTTQYLEEADLLSDRIAVIDRGTKVAEGTTKELKSTLGATIVEIEFDRHEDPRRALSIFDDADTGDLEDGSSVVALRVEDSGRSVLAIARALDNAELPPESIRVREPTLDDVFLSLTGTLPTDARDSSGPGNQNGDVL